MRRALGAMRIMLVVILFRTLVSTSFLALLRTTTRALETSSLNSNEIVDGAVTTEPSDGDVISSDECAKTDVGSTEKKASQMANAPHIKRRTEQCGAIELMIIN